MEFLRKYNTATNIYIPIIKRGVVDFALGADWTPAAGDVKISKDGGVAANVTNLPTAITMGNTAMWNFSLTATEMQAAKIVISVADSATKAVEDQMFLIGTYGNAAAEHAADFDDAVRLGLSALPAAAAEAAGGLYTRGGGAGQINQNANGQIDVRAVAITDALLTAAKFAAGAFDAVWSVAVRILTAGTNIVLAKGVGVTGFTDIDAAGVRAAVGLAAADLDTQLGGINAKTTNLPTDPADQSLIIEATDAIMSRLGLPAGASVSADVAAVKSDTAAALTRLPAALIGGRMDSSVGAMTVDVITSGVIAASAANKIADHVIRRTFANARLSADGDAVAFRSLLGAEAKLVNKWAIAGSVLTIYQEDDATALGTQNITGTAGADPITTLDTV